MSLRTQYSVTATVKRLVATGNKTTYTTVATIKGHKQPLSDTFIALAAGNFSKSFSFYVAVDANAVEGDQLTIGSEIYYVRAERKFDIGSAAQQHKELMIELKDV